VHHFSPHTCMQCNGRVQDSNHSDTMINAVLVFNNAGQPRLTKFYTQLVHTILPLSHVRTDTM
jgi:hypothetical protein